MTDLVDHELNDSRWQHLKTGHFVTIVGTTRLEATNEPAFRYVEDATGVEWARSMDQFLDGRFDRITPPATAPGAQGGEVEETAPARAAEEPRGCPTPGACSCPKPDAVAETAGPTPPRTAMDVCRLLEMWDRGVNDDLLSDACSIARAVLRASCQRAPEPPVWRHDFNAYVPVQRSARSEADETVAKAREALEPFAKVAEWARRNGRLNGYDCLLRGLPDGEMLGHLQVQERDFERARAALNALRKAGEETGR